MSAVSDDDWARVGVDDVVELLTLDELNVPDEHSVLDAALAWLNHVDDGRRRRHAARLLAAVKLPLLSPQVRFRHTHDLGDIRFRNPKCGFGYIIIDRVAGEIIRLVSSVCVRVCPFVCGSSADCTV